MFMECFWAITVAYWAYFLIPTVLVAFISWVTAKREERRFAAMLSLIHI